MRPGKQDSCPYSRRARVDTVPYPINVGVRPGFSLVNSEAAVEYGRGICQSILQHRPYDDVVDQVKSDFGFRDELHASYLNGHAVNRLFPEVIWQLRSSAA